MGAKLALALLAVRCLAQTVDPAALALTGVWQLDGAVYATPQLAGSCLIVATMGGSVYCLDPTHPGVVTWRIHLADPRTAGTATAFYGKTIGCLSKPAVDASHVYAVCGSPAAWTVYTLDLASGAVLGSAVVSASLPGSGCGGTDPVSGGNLLFSATEEIQRPALLIHDSTLIVAFGSLNDVSPWHGWVMSYDVSAAIPVMLHAWTSTPSGCGGAVWHSAAPVAWDGSFLYLATGNGTYDGAANLSMSVVKLDASLNVVAHWTPAMEGTLNAADADVASGAPLILGSVLAIGFKDWRARLLFLSDLSLAADVPTNPSPPALDGDSGIYGGFFDGTRVYFPNKPGPIYAFTFTAGGLTPLAVGPTSYASTMALASTSGVLWAVTSAVDPYGVTPWKPVTGTLRALDPATLAEFWHADIGRLASFSGPCFSDQHVYVANVDGVVRMFSHDTPVAQSVHGNSMTLLGWQQ